MTRIGFLAKMAWVGHLVVDFLVVGFSGGRFCIRGTCTLAPWMRSSKASGIAPIETGSSRS